MAVPDTDTSSVLYKPSAEGITLISINKPQVRNAVNAATATLLTEAFRRFEQDESQKVCILTGAGGHTFCAGYDLREVATSPAGSNIVASGAGAGGAATATATATTTAPPPPPSLAASRVKPVTTTDPGAAATALQDILGPMGPSRMLLSKPLIAAVSGHAVAGGLELSLLADLRVCDTTAVFGVFCRRWGVPLIDGGTVRLPRVVGLGRALDMILTGRPVDAHEALSMGLANRVVPFGTAVDEAMEVARSLLAFPQLCMRADRRSAYYGVYEAKSLVDALRFEYDGGIDVVGKEGVAGAARFDKGQGRGGSFDLVKGNL